MASGLLGIVHSNREDDRHWTKNCFNSSFPASLACYMLEKNIPAVYINLQLVKKQLQLVATEIPIQKVFNCGTLQPKELYFSFETIFKPYEVYSFEHIDGIDLVIKNLQHDFLAPLEVKLTVIPDNSTCKKAEKDWGAEMVIRSATTSYCALGMYDAVKEYKRDVREIFETACASIQSWDNEFEMTHKLESVISSINMFEKKFYKKQKPLVMQTLWKTKGKSPFLADQAFDIVIWSDFAFSRLFLDSPLDSERMSRPMRASARLGRCLWELSKSDKIHLQDIYRQMAFGNQTDKEFSIPGRTWKSFVNTVRTVTPKLNKNVLEEIISSGYIDKLSPERRFDQTLYFTMRNTHE